MEAEGVAGVDGELAAEADAGGEEVAVAVEVFEEGVGGVVGFGEGGWGGWSGGGEERVGCRWCEGPGVGGGVGGLGWFWRRRGYGCFSRGRFAK